MPRNKTAKPVVEAIPVDDDGVPIGDATYTPEDDQATDTSVATEDNADAVEAPDDGDRDPAYAVFTVVGHCVANSKERQELGETVNFIVTRHAKGRFTATDRVGTDESKETRKAKTAIESFMNKVKWSKERILFDAEAAEPAMPETSDNLPSAAWFDRAPDEAPSEAQSRLAEIEATLHKIADDLNHAGVTTRQAWRGFGGAYKAAKDLFNEITPEGEKGNRLWGQWAKTHFAKDGWISQTLQSKNAPAQAVLFASAPDAVVEAVGVNTASTFEQRVNTAVSTFSSTVAEMLMKAHCAASEQNTVANAPDLDLATSMAKANEVQNAAIEQYQAEYVATEASNKQLFDAGKSPVPLARDTVSLGKRNMIIDWLLPDTLADYDGCKIAKAVAAAYADERVQPSEAEKVEGAAKKTVEAMKKTFTEWSAVDAAKHLLVLLCSHPDAGSILEMLNEDYPAWVETQAEKAKADEETTNQKADEEAEATA